MVCPFCQAQETSVVDSRKNSEGNSVRRRRSCITCKLRFTTYEKASIGLIVIKRSGNREEFNIEKLYSGVQYAFGGQELTEKKLKSLIESIYKDIEGHGSKVRSEVIGETVLSHLKEVNEVAYVRFASVYKEFSDASDFEKEVAEFN